MVITKDFVFIHMPKTGGTFVTEMLRKAYLGYRYEVDKSQFTVKDKCLHLRHRLLRKLSLSPWVLHTNKHGPCNEIPSRYKSLPILSCIRNPFAWYVSSYEYEWWKRHPEDYPGLADNPNFPGLSFAQFLQLQNEWLNFLNPGVAVDPTIGRVTALFINFYFRRPDAVLQSLAVLESKERIAAEMYPVTFLHTETLNRDLSMYLSQFVSSTRRLSQLQSEKPVLPEGRMRRKIHWREYYDRKMLAEIRERDRLIFSLFPAYDTER